MLAKELSLQTECGYVELVRLSVEDGWLVFDVIYGLPLFADKVAKQVLENVTSFQLLHQDNIEQVYLLIDFCFALFFIRFVFFKAQEECSFSISSTCSICWL